MFVFGLFSSSSNEPERESPPNDPETTLISEDASIEGAFDLGSVNIRVEGHVNGDIDTEGRVVVAEGAEVVGTIDAQSVRLGGYAEGEVYAEEEITLTPTAKVRAVLETDVLVIEAGADFSGSVAGDEPVPEIADSSPSGFDTTDYNPVPDSSRRGSRNSNGELEAT